jgi:hypothetical protein|tara:strand:+ start:418 stop:999 length:582 start_codon:yes stop_codon:yes gene_type:complete
MANFNAIRYNVPYSSAGNLKLITTSTASSSATISFTSGIDSTYKEYLFIFNSIHAASNEYLTFNLSADSGSNYNVTKTTTMFNAYHNEGDSGAGIQYRTDDDLAQSTDFQRLRAGRLGTGNDECFAGTLRLFNPSSTTFVKHFIAEVSNLENAYEGHTFIAGYGNTTSAVDAIQFKMSSGNIDAGTIQMFGVL